MEKRRRTKKTRRRRRRRTATKKKTRRRKEEESWERGKRRGKGWRDGREGGRMKCSVNVKPAQLGEKKKL